MSFTLVWLYSYLCYSIFIRWIHGLIIRVTKYLRMLLRERHAQINKPTSLLLSHSQRSEGVVFLFERSNKVSFIIVCFVCDQDVFYVELLQFSVSIHLKLTFSFNMLQKLDSWRFTSPFSRWHPQPCTIQVKCSALIKVDMCFCMCSNSSSLPYTNCAIGQMIFTRRIITFFSC